VFSLGSNAFGNGNAQLTAAAANQLKAVAEYLAITNKRGRIRIEGYDRAAGVGQRRAEAIRDALGAAGVAANRLQVVGRTAAATRARAAEIVIAP
jgi:outer membrane protein OmpA-like peptidoglycan-associated protein